MKTKKKVVYALVAYVVFVFIQSLFYKFSGSEQTIIIFSTIAAWISDIGLDKTARIFEQYGGNLVGITELVASILLIVPLTRKIGGLLGMSVISGAIFFHLFTPLGVNRVIDAAGNTDSGVLFYMACGVWLSCLLILILDKRAAT